MYHSKETCNESLEMFIKKVEKEETKFTKFTKRWKNTLAEIKKWENNTVRVKDKGSWFVVLNNDGYVHKVEDQIKRSSFLQ